MLYPWATPLTPTHLILQIPFSHYCATLGMHLLFRVFCPAQHRKTSFKSYALSTWSTPCVVRSAGINVVIVFQEDLDACSAAILACLSKSSVVCTSCFRPWGLRRSGRPPVLEGMPLEKDWEKRNLWGSSGLGGTKQNIPDRSSFSIGMETSKRVAFFVGSDHHSKTECQQTGFKDPIVFS